MPLKSPWLHKVKTYLRKGNLLRKLQRVIQLRSQRSMLSKLLLSRPLRWRLFKRHSRRLRRKRLNRLLKTHKLALKSNKCKRSLQLKKLMLSKMH